jgi:hypothetical protein
VGDLDFRLLSRQCCRIRSGPFISSFFKKKIMSAILSVQNLSKQYDGGFQALKNVSLDIEQGEILALARPQRRRQDDADLDHLRARDASPPGACASAAMTSSTTSAQAAR